MSFQKCQEAKMQEEQKIIHPSFQLQLLPLPCSNSLAALTPPARLSQHDMDSDFLLLDRFLPLTQFLAFWPLPMIEASESRPPSETRSSATQSYNFMNVKCSLCCILKARPGE